MEEPSPGADKVEAGDLGAAIAFLSIAAGLTAFGMYYFWTYPWPSGRHPTGGEFLMFWFREILLFGAIAVGLVVAGISRIVRAIRGDGVTHAL